MSTPVSCWSGSVRRCGGIARVEWRLLSRSALFRISAVVCWGIAMLLVHGVMTVVLTSSSPLGIIADTSDGCAGFLNIQIILFVPPMVAFIAASSAARERRPGIAETLLTTPPSSEELVLGKFASVMLCSMALLAGTLLFGYAWLRWGEAVETRVLPFYLVGLQWVEPILYIACLSYVASLLLPGASGVVLVFFYWIAVCIGCLSAVNVSSAFLPVFGYLSAGYLTIGLGMVFLSAVFYRRERRGSHREQSAPVGLAGVLLVAGGAMLLCRNISSFHTPPFHRDPALAELNREHARVGQTLPPFRLLDNTGRALTPATLLGRPTVIVMLQTLPPAATVISAPLLRALVFGNEHSGETPARIILVFLTRDPGMATAWARDMPSDIQVVTQYGKPLERVQGLPAMMGMDWPQNRHSFVPGMVAVLDSRGRYLGYRPIYEVVTPPALLSVLRGGVLKATGMTEAQATNLEQRSAIRFFRSLWQYDRDHPN